MMSKYSLAQLMLVSIINNYSQAQAVIVSISCKSISRDHGEEDQNNPLVSF